MEKLEGIVVSEKAYGETSKIVNILTESGLVSAMAKGAKTLKSSLRSGTTKLTYASFQIIEKENKLSVLTGADIINNYSSIKKDINKISYASYLLELATQVMKQNNDKMIYQLLIDSLDKINDGFDYRVITNILELKYLAYLGVLPVLDGCSICGSKTNIVTLSGSRGGYICRNCVTNDPIVSEKTIKLIRLFYYVDIKKIDKLEVSEEVKKEINSFLDSYYELYTGLYLKTKYLLNKIKR